MRKRIAGGGMASSTRFVYLFATVCLIQIALAAKKKIYYVDAERINVTYINPKYLRSANITARRYGRSDPIHYVHVHSENIIPFGNNILIDAYVYEFLSNEYRRSFVELHYKMCDLFVQNKILGPALAKVLPACPVAKGVYHLVNMSVPDFPLLHTFPFQKGRLYVNLTHIGPGDVRERVGELYGDATIKERWV